MMAHLIGETERTKAWPVAVTYTKLQALELAKEWLDEYRKAGDYWDEDGEENRDCQGVADRLSREILLERQREKEAGRHRSAQAQSQQ
jgi:hypothetical protein